MSKTDDFAPGVGPHPAPWPNNDDARYDQSLLENGDHRNVIDKYRYMTVKAIHADLMLTHSSLLVAIENWEHDMNIGTIVRTANAFNVAGVHVIGRRHWNKRGAMVTDKYINVYHHATVAEFVDAVKGNIIVAVDNLEGAQPLHQVTLPKNCVLVFGSEQSGLSPEMVAASERMVAIEQFGSTRSLNAGVAAGIVMHAWQQQHIL